jgi:two-component system sensor histidine kinase TctE
MAQTLTAEWVPRALKAQIDLGMDDQHHQSVWVNANELLMREALTNLIDNALQYAGPARQVTVRVKPAPQAHQHPSQPMAWLEVIDNGPGISKRDQASVFERFVRATDAGNGCGLGLAIVKEIVERHDGHVLLSDAKPQGLRVRVSLPMVPPASPGN